MFWALIFISIICILAALKSLRTYKKYNLPGPKPLPIFGNMFHLGSDSTELYLQLINLSESFKEDGLYTLWFGTYLTIIVTRVEVIEEVLTNSALITKSRDYKFIKPWIGDGLLLSTGDKWHKRRKLLTPAFHFKVLDIFLHSFNKHSSKLVDVLRNRTGRTFDIAPFIALSALDMICETAMGIDLKAIDNSNSEYVEAVQRISTLITMRAITFWLWPDFIFNLTSTGKEHNKCLNTLHSFTKNVIKEKKLTKNESNEAFDEQNKKFALLDLLLKAEESKELKDEDIQEEVDTFMFEGHDTTATTLNWLIYLIAMHNDVQERIFREIVDVLGESMVDVSPSDLRKLKYLECVIKETLRLYPTVPSFSREVIEPLTLGKFEIPVGANLSILTSIAHRDPKYFKDPNKFDPDRWLEDGASVRNPFTYIPFSAGMRNCIGQKFAMMEMKVVLTWLLRSFKISTSVKEKDFEPVLGLVLRPKNGVEVYLEERN